MSISKDNIVIVIDISNYKLSYSEPVPFKGVVTYKSDRVVTVESMDTGIEYELYYYQVLEFLDIQEISKIIDLSKY